MTSLQSHGCHTMKSHNSRKSLKILKSWNLRYKELLNNLFKIKNKISKIFGKLRVFKIPSSHLLFVICPSEYFLIIKKGSFAKKISILTWRIHDALWPIYKGSLHLCVCLTWNEGSSFSVRKIQYSWAHLHWQNSEIESEVFTSGLEYEQTHHAKEERARIKEQKLASGFQISGNLIDVAFVEMRFEHYLNKGLQ